MERMPNRLKGYDYGSGGYYFVTICSLNRRQWFGKIKNAEMIPNPLGQIALDSWREIPLHFKGVHLDEFSLMPNHIHGIVIIGCNAGDAYMRPLQDRTKMLLSKLMQQYKSAVTRKINRTQDDLCFSWQRSFYDHVVRSESELNRIREYIQNNPLNWDLDIENPSSKNFNANHNHYWKEILDSLS